MSNFCKKPQHQAIFLQFLGLNAKMSLFYQREIVMVSMYLLIPLSLMLSAVAIWAIVYAVKSNQFEDLDNAPEQIILDDRQERRELIDKQP